MTLTTDPATTSKPLGMPMREDRIRRYVNAFCPRCHDEVPNRPLHQVPRLSGYLSEAEDQVWLVRGCPQHGKVVTLYEENPGILSYLEQWTAPTKWHVPDTPGNYDPIPAAYLRGLGEMQTQHTCILLEDITQACNLRCPTCFADSSPQLSGVASVDDVLANVDQRLDRENGRLDVLMLSGGEPTIHPQFAELVERVLERDVTRVLINTNGVIVTSSNTTYINGKEQDNVGVLEGVLNEGRALNGGTNIFTVDGGEDIVQAQFSETAIYIIEGN